MGKGFYARKLNGNCYVGTSVCRPLETISLHVMCDTRRVAAPMFDQSAYIGNEVIPTSKTHGVTGYAYNNLMDNQATEVPWFHLGSELETWSPRTITLLGYPITFEGPTFRMPHCVIGLLDRPPSQEFQNRTGAYFTDSQVRTNRFDDPLCEDWLGFLHPGGFMYTPKEIPEPMKCTSFLEDGGWVPDISSLYAMHYNVMRFENPVSVYDKKVGGTKIGQYVGLSFVPFFGECAIKNPIGNLPDDPSVPFPPGGTLTKEGHLVSLDLWFYLLAEKEFPSSPLKSPRISSLRGWLPKANLTSGINTSWCDKYVYATFNANDDDYNSFTPSINFCLVGGGETNKRVVLSNFKAYITA